MPRSDGTGPRGLGPMTGRGEGCCALAVPSAGTGRTPYGYAGLPGRPVQLSADGSPARIAYPGSIPPIPSRPWPPFFGTWLGRGFGRRCGWSGGQWR